MDAMLCAAAEASDASPKALRPVLHVAFKRARELGLSVEDVEAALAPPKGDNRKGATPKKGTPRDG